jgi:hypothetical protein
LNLKPGHAALSGARTIFLKTVKAADSPDVRVMMQSASTNRKLGNGKKTILKGRWAGMDLYQLVLEERATCPRSCQQWSNCYGNNMYLAKRIDHRDWPAFKARLESELAGLATKHPAGFAVRLHVLGDFFSKRYVDLWRRALVRHPQLRVFGYTHRWPGQGDGIGEALGDLNDRYPDRWSVRFSDRGGRMSANVGAAAGAGDIQCPQEVGKTESCLTCALCWQTDKPIMFTEH